jgi:hypothetical protein
VSLLFERTILRFAARDFARFVRLCQQAAATLLVAPSRGRCTTGDRLDLAWLN